MLSSQPLILVIGGSSIGERHVRTFLATGKVGVIACDNRPAICEEIGNRYQVETTADRESTLANGVVVVIATPAISHVEIATHDLKFDQHVLIEKPLSTGSAIGPPLP